MKILAIDTASKICSVAVLEDEKIVDEINLDNGLTHSENLMPIVAEILEKNKMVLEDFDAISCSTGPGSFTGIRIGIATVKALAEVKNLPVIGITSLETLAKNDVSSHYKVCLIDARNNQVYAGVFDENYKLVGEYMADDIAIVLEAVKIYGESVFIGDGAVLHKNFILEKIPTANFCKENEQKASAGGLLAYQKWQRGEIKNADTILPVYLRKSQAERLKNRE